MESFIKFKMKKVIYRIISSIDLVATFLILLYHAIFYYSLINIPLSQSVLAFEALLVNCGLTAFTFSSGFKLYLNHSQNFNNKDFFIKYIIKRWRYLYGLYIVYPILIYSFVHVIYIIFRSLNINEYIYPYYNQLSKIDTISIVKFLFFGIPPVASHIWYIFVLLLITTITLIVIRLVSLKKVLCIILPILIVYFFAKPHYLQAIGPNELIYYVLLYGVVFMYGMFAGYLYVEKNILFNRFTNFMSVIFILLLICFIRFDLRDTILTSNYLFTLIYQNYLFKYGFTFPLFLIVAFTYFKESFLVKILHKSRKYMLPIFFLQYPLLIPFFSYVFKIFFPQTPASILLVPFLITLVCIISSIKIYDFMEYIFRKFFSKSIVTFNS